MHAPKRSEKEGFALSSDNTHYMETQCAPLCSPSQLRKHSLKRLVSKTLVFSIQGRKVLS